MRRATTDIDFVTLGAGNAEALARAVAGELDGLVAHVYPAFGTAAVRVPAGVMGAEEFVLEFVGARRESYRADSRKPVVEDGTLDDDLARRDFTVNALAISLNAGRFGDISDPTGGLTDLAGRRLRTPLDPEKTFEDDPLRMMRAARFAAQLGFLVEPAAIDAMRAMAARIEIVSQERITDELQRTIASPAPARGLALLYDTGILHHVFPEFVRLAGVEAVGSERHKDNLHHTLEVLENLVALQRGVGVDERAEDHALWLRWAALLHDIAKPDTKRFIPGTGWTFHGHDDRGSRQVARIFRRLRLPLGEPARYVSEMVRLHHRPVALVDDEVSDSAVRRLLFEAGDDIDDLMMLVRADVTSKNPARVRRYLAGFDRVEAKMREVEEKDRLRSFQPPVDGVEIMESLGLEPGPAVGALKNALEQAILDGLIPNEHDAAFDYLMAIKDEVLAGVDTRDRGR
jgi:poly(A) polymerase